MSRSLDFFGISLRYTVGNLVNFGFFFCFIASTLVLVLNFLKCY